MSRKPVSPNRYAGIAIGGPRKGQHIGHPESVYELCRMVKVPPWDRQPGDLPFTEIGRGEYHYESGHWWWQGWDK